VLELMSLGFEREKIQQALKQHQNDLQRTSLWLIQVHASPSMHIFVHAVDSFVCFNAHTDTSATRC
jgi:hypothetical protein